MSINRLMQKIHKCILNLAEKITNRIIYPLLYYNITIYTIIQLLGYLLKIKIFVIKS